MQDLLSTRNMSQERIVLALAVLLFLFAAAVTYQKRLPLCIFQFGSFMVRKILQ